MSASSAVITVSHSQYWIIDRSFDPEIDEAMYRDFNGLVSAQGAFAIIMTGTEQGPVRLDVELLEDEPPASEAGWDDIVEVSLDFEDEGAFTSEAEQRNRQLPFLPEGACRLRVHARGRDIAWELGAVRGDPIEEHLIQVWPAPSAPEVSYKLTDAYGASIRGR